MVVQYIRGAWVAKLDIDSDDPFKLATKIYKMGERICFFRLSSHKGVHLKVIAATKRDAELFRAIFDDPIRLVYDENRRKHKFEGFIGALWDIKDGKMCSEWVETTTISIGAFLINSPHRSLRNAMESMIALLKDDDGD